MLRLSPSGWGEGNIGVLVEHQLDDGTSYIAIYGHVRSEVVVGDEVAGGVPFATIGPWSPPHLHFAIRPGTSIASPYGKMPCPATGPITETNGFVDPIEWITTRAPAGRNEAGDSYALDSDEGGAEPSPPQESHLEREARFIHWLEQQCASVGAAMMLPMVAYAVSRRRRT